jgi:Flp pilus assembly pilin Flp
MALQRWLDRIRSRCSVERAQTMAEYAVVLAVITPAIVFGFGDISDAAAATFDRVAALFT